MKASGIQRFLAYIIDIGLIFIISYYLTKLTLYLTSYNTERFNELYELITESYTNYAKGNIKNLIDEIGKSNLIEFLKLYLIQQLVSLGFELLLVVAYLIILPRYWKYQTVGRYVSKCKVIRHEGEIDVTLKNILLRELVGTFLFYLILGPMSIVAWISALLASFTGRSLADRVSGCDFVMNEPVYIDPNNPLFKMNENKFNIYGEDNINNNDLNNESKKEKVIDAEVEDSKPDDNNDNDEDEYIVI